MGGEHHDRSRHGEPEQGHAADLIDLIDGVPDAVLAFHRRAVEPGPVGVGVADIGRGLARRSIEMGQGGHRKIL